MAIGNEIEPTERAIGEAGWSFAGDVSRISTSLFAGAHDPDPLSQEAKSIGRPSLLAWSSDSSCTTEACRRRCSFIRATTWRSGYLDELKGPSQPSVSPDARSLARRRMQIGAPDPLNGFARSPEYACAAAVSHTAGCSKGDDDAENEARADRLVDTFCIRLRIVRRRSSGFVGFVRRGCRAFAADSAMHRHDADHGSRRCVRPM